MSTDPACDMCGGTIHVRPVKVDLDVPVVLLCGPCWYGMLAGEGA
jgi:ribosome-binding protein aMBF1 (putative translation factor)